MLKNLKENWIIFFALLIIIFCIILNICIFNNFSKVLEIKEIESSIIVSDKIGFDLNSTALTFGEVSKGGSSTREIKLENNFDFPIKVYIYGKGEIKDFIVPFEEIIEKNESRNIKITASAPDNSDFGKYNGKVVVRIEKLGNQ